MDTKARIVSGAVALFNRDGVSEVTTNHIAAHVGMSPGNLYYHFRNKEEIIRAAFERMDDRAEELWGKTGPSLDEGGLGDLRRMLTGNLEIYTEYLFFARELPLLLRADPELRRRYREVHTRRLSQLENVFQGLVNVGILRVPGGKPALRPLAESCWVIAMFWMPYVELQLEDQSAKARPLARGARLLLEILRPYFTEGVYELLDAVVSNAEKQEPAPKDKPSQRPRTAKKR